MALEKGYCVTMGDSCVLLSTFKQLLDAGLLPDGGLPPGLTQSLLTGGDMSALRTLMQTMVGGAPESPPPTASPTADSAIHAQLRRRLPRRQTPSVAASTPPITPLGDTGSPPVTGAPRSRPLLLHADEGRLVDNKLRIHHEQLCVTAPGTSSPAVDDTIHRLKQTLRVYGPCSAILTTTDHIVSCVLQDVKYFVNMARNQRIVEFTLEGGADASRPGGCVTAVKIFVSDVVSTE